MSAIKCNDRPLSFVKYEKIEEKKPQYIGQTSMLDCGRNIIIWYVEAEDKYYACIS